MQRVVKVITPLRHQTRIRLFLGLDNARVIEIAFGNQVMFPSLVTGEFLYLLESS